MTTVAVIRAPATAPMIVTKVVAGLVGAVALCGVGYGVYLVAIGATDDPGADDSLAGLAILVGVVLLGLGLPVLGLCLATVLSRNPLVVGICGLVLAAGMGLTVLVSLTGYVSVASVVALAVAIGTAVASVLSIVGRTTG